MVEKLVSEMTNEELVEITDMTIFGLPTGLKAQIAQIEMTRRLIVALHESKDSADKFNIVLFYLTTLLFVVAFAQLILTSSTLPNFPLWTRVIGTIIIMVGILISAWWFARKIGLDK